MQDPCNPLPHHVQGTVHHHNPGQVIGRIRRHGTHRIAHRLHALAGACAAGPPLVVGSATLKVLAPAAAFIAATTIASSLTAPSPIPVQAFGAAGIGGYGIAGGTGAVGVAPRKHTTQPHPPISMPEPSSLALLLLVIVAWIGLRIGFRRKSPPAR